MSIETDVAIIGGGPAGLTAGLALARIGRKVMIFDDNKGRNFPAEHMMNFPSRDGTPPKEFKELIIKDLRKYHEVSFQSDRVKMIRKESNGFVLNEAILARKIILAHGVRDILPDIPGVKELWGRAVFHCPYCHGHEFKREKIGVMSSDANYLNHMVPLLLGLSNDVTVFTNGVDVDLATPLLKRVNIVPDEVKRLVHEGDFLRSVETSDDKVKLAGLVIKPPQELTSDIGTKLGCELNEFGLYKTENEVQTTIAGVFAAGDVSMPMQSVILACASGMKAAAQASFALAKEALT